MDRHLDRHKHVTVANFAPVRSFRRVELFEGGVRSRLPQVRILPIMTLVPDAHVVSLSAAGEYLAGQNSGILIKVREPGSESSEIAP
jgi:hypothetical protein